MSHEKGGRVQERRAHLLDHHVGEGKNERWCLKTQIANDKGREEKKKWQRKKHDWNRPHTFQDVRGGEGRKGRGSYTVPLQVLQGREKGEGKEK